MPSEGFFALTAGEAVATEPDAFRPPDGHALRYRVPFGIYHIDSALAGGVEPLTPQIYAIQGGSGARKTTFAINVILNQVLSGKLPPDMTIGMDMLETGMTVERLFLIMECIVATKIMIYEFHTGPQDQDSLWQLFNRHLPPRSSPREFLEPITSGNLPDTRLKPGFLKACYRGYPGKTLSERQIDAWERAADVVSRFPIMAFGVSEHFSNDIRQTRYTDTADLSATLERWLACTKEYGMRQLMVDFLQEYRITNGNDHYQKQKEVVPIVAEWVKQTGSTAWVISQEGITHQRDARSYGGEVLGSSGGDILKAQSQTNFRQGYSPSKNPFWTIIYRPVKSRDGHWPTVAQAIEPDSGAFFGTSRLYSEIKGQLG